MNSCLRNKQNPGFDLALHALLKSINLLTVMFVAQAAFNSTEVNTLLHQLEAQSSACDRKFIANSGVISVITNRLNILD